MNPGLVGALYLESPYVDVLRTITNPELPLTTLETTEFGSSNDPVNIISTASWSPIEHIPVEGVPELFVVARTDTQDLEVFPYEVIKFIQRTRGTGGGQKKLLYIHHGLGHFTTSWKSRAEDLSLLNKWIDFPDKDPAVRRKNHLSKYSTMPMSRKNRSTRKNRDRKNKNRKNKNNMAGGKRTRRHHRKH